MDVNKPRPKVIYAPIDQQLKVTDWMEGPGGTYKNYDQYMRPLRPGEKTNLDDPVSQELMQAIRDRMLRGQ